MTTNYRGILRFKSLGLNKTDIASVVQCARKTVSVTLERAKACGLQWPLPEGISDKELAEKLLPAQPGKLFSKCRLTHMCIRRSSNTAVAGIAELGIQERYTA